MELTFGTYNLEYGGIDNGDDARLLPPASPRCCDSAAAKVSHLHSNS